MPRAIRTVNGYVGTISRAGHQVRHPSSVLDSARCVRLLRQAETYTRGSVCLLTLQINSFQCCLRSA
jgi:hypothetical protein